MFEGWRRKPAADGVALTSPSGPTAGIVRVRTGKPPRPVARCLPALEGDLDVRRLVTEVGEYTAIATLRSGTALYLAGAVAAESYVLIQGMCADGDRSRFATDFEALVRRCVTGDDPNRRRLYPYEPPAGWRPNRTPFSTRWYPSGCPLDPAYFEVFDALSSADPAAQFTHDLMVGPIGDRRIARESDARFTYELHYVDPNATGAHDDAFARLVSSIEHLPRADADSRGGEDTFAWVT